MAPTSTSTTTHVRKRQYQPSITSYLIHGGDDDDRERAAPRVPRTPLSPPLPAETQAQLLAVGMRIRKSVPEGYKTHKTMATEGFPFPSTAPPALATPAAKPSYCNAKSRELLPFCGLHKVGNWAHQEHMPPSPELATVDTDDDDDTANMPALSMSPSTVASTQNSFTSTYSSREPAIKKRALDEETEEDTDAFLDEVDREDAAALNRRIAQPRSSQRKTPTVLRLDRETDDNDDFEEATFLVPMDVDHT